MPFLPVIVTPVAALFVALLESLAGCGEGTAARFAHVARAACLAGLLRIGVAAACWGANVSAAPNIATAAANVEIAIAAGLKILETCVCAMATPSVAL